MHLLLVHGSPRRIYEYLFADRSQDSLLRIIRQADADIRLFGHTHIPYHKKLAYESGGDIKFAHAINTGPVGKPKAKDSRACYCWLELHNTSNAADPAYFDVSFIRVAYDLHAAATANQESSLPDE